MKRKYNWRSAIKEILDGKPSAIPTKAMLGELLSLEDCGYGDDVHHWSAVIGAGTMFVMAMRDMEVWATYTRKKGLRIFVDIVDNPGNDSYPEFSVDGILQAVIETDEAYDEDEFREVANFLRAWADKFDAAAREKEEI